jgi:hypothetical protein
VGEPWLMVVVVCSADFVEVLELVMASVDLVRTVARKRGVDEDPGSSCGARAPALAAPHGR